MFNQYPYLNLNDLNLDYLLNEIKRMYNDVTNFVSINAIKYADPIQWNITSQYEKNTVVIDPLTGTAYISVAAVPSGVALTRTEYWTVVFDLGSFVVRAAKNFTTRFEEATTLTATFSTTAGEWLVWGDTLYIANVNITAGDSYVVGGNIRRITIEEVKNTIIQLINDNYDTIVDMIGILDDLTTTDKTNIVAAINSLKSEIGNLEDLNTTDKSSLVAAINENASNIDDMNETIEDVRDSGLFYQNAARHGISLQTSWTREYSNSKKAKSFSVHENILLVLFEDNSLEVYDISANPWSLQNTLTLNNAIAIANDSSYIYALEASRVVKYNYTLATVDTMTVVTNKYSRIRIWNDKIYLLKTTSSSLDVFNSDFTEDRSIDYVGQHQNTMFAVSDKFAVFGLMGNRSNHVYNNDHPERYEWIFTYPIYSNTQNPIPNTFDVCARNSSTFWILSNNIAAHNGVNLLTLSQYDLIFGWDGAQYDNTNSPIVNLTQYVTPEMKNTIQKISGSRNTPYSDFDHAQDEIGLCPKLYSILYASNNNADFPELYLENIAIPIRIAIDTSHTGTPNFAGIYISNCNHVELSRIKSTGKVSENYTGSIFIRNSKVLLDSVVIDRGSAAQDIQARDGSEVYCYNCTPAHADMLVSTRLSTVTQYPT